MLPMRGKLYQNIPRSYIVGSDDDGCSYGSGSTTDLVGACAADDSDDCSNVDNSRRQALTDRGRASHYSLTVRAYNAAGEIIHEEGPQPIGPNDPWEKKCETKCNGNDYAWEVELYVSPNGSPSTLNFKSTHDYENTAGDIIPFYQYFSSSFWTGTILNWSATFHGPPLAWKKLFFPTCRVVATTLFLLPKTSCLILRQESLLVENCHCRRG